MCGLPVAFKYVATFARMYVSKGRCARLDGEAVERVLARLLLRHARVDKQLLDNAMRFSIARCSCISASF